MNAPTVAVQPVVNWPRFAQVGKRYLVTVDAVLAEPFEWPYNREEFLVGCVVDGGDAFTVEALGSTSVVLHRFGGTYGPVRFAVSPQRTLASDGSDRLRITLVTEGGLPFPPIDLSVLPDGADTNTVAQAHQLWAMTMATQPTWTRLPAQRADADESASLSPVARRIALLIGVNADGLRGPENDTAAIEAALTRHGFSVTRASGAEAKRDRILAALESIVAETARDDTVFLFFSGHGGAATVSAPDDHGGYMNLRIPFIVPADFRDDASFGGITSIEVSELLARLASRTRNVVAAFDCNYGCTPPVATAGPPDAPARGNLSAERLDALARHIAALHTAGTPLLPATNPNVVMLHGCGSTEVAYETDTAEGRRMGAFSAALSSALEEATSLQVTWAALIDHVGRLIRTRSGAQRPFVIGPSQRLLFSTIEDEYEGSLPIVVDGPSRARILGAALLAVQPGDEFAVVPAGTAGPAEAARIAHAIVDETIGIEAKAHLELRPTVTDLPIGARAYRIRAVAPYLPIKLPPSSADVSSLASAISTSQLLRIVADETYEYEIRTDGTGNVSIADAIGPLSDPIPIGNTQTIVRSLERLARAASLRELKNDRRWPLDSEIAVEWGTVAEGRLVGMRLSGDTVYVGQRIFVRVGNHGLAPIFVSLINIGVAAAVTVLTDLNPSGLRLDPGQQYIFGASEDGEVPGVELRLPRGLDQSHARIEQILVLLTSEPLDVNVLQQPGVAPVSRLDQSPVAPRLAHAQNGSPGFATHAGEGEFRYTVQAIDFLLDPHPAPAMEEPTAVEAGQESRRRATSSGGLIGRAPERRQLTGWLTAATNERPSVVFIDGDPGVGKTTLVEWLVGEAQQERALVLKGGCIELGSGSAIPFGALTEGLRLLTRQLGNDYRHLLESRPWMTLAGLTSDSLQPATATTDARLIFGAVLGLPDQIGRKHSALVLIFEDLHWADVSTLDLVRYVAMAKSDQRLLLVCTHRPVPPTHPLRALLTEPDFYRRIDRISLPRFSRSELDEFVTARAAAAGWTVSDDRLGRYYKLSEGNAYYAEELVAADDPRNPDVRVPQSLRELMTARLNQLSDDAAHVMRIAAVAGRVGGDLLTAVSDLDDQTLDGALAECIDQRILVNDGIGTTYAFQHGLLRDTAYHNIGPSMRKLIHRRLAQAMEAELGAGTRLVPELAHHWFEAGRMPEALAAAVRAAEVAVRMRAFPDAAALYERVLGLWPDIPEAAELAGAPLERVLCLAADAARWAGDVVRALEWVRRAIAVADPNSDPGQAGELQERLGSHLWEVGQSEEAFAAFTEAERLLADLPASAIASRVQAALATAVMRRGDYMAGRWRAERAVELARSVGARTEEGQALSSLGLALAFDGQVDAGERALRSAVAIATEADHLEGLFRAYGTLGVCLEQGGRLDEAVSAMTEGLARAKEFGLLHTRQSDVLANNAAAALLLLGRYEESAALLDPVLLSRTVAESMYARLTRAEIHVAHGEFANAERLLAEIGRESNSDPRFVGPLYGCIADSLAWQRDLDKADEVVAQGMIAIAGTMNRRVVVQLCAVGLRIAADRKDTRRANELLDAVRRVVIEPDVSEIEWLTRQCHADYDRAINTDTPQLWAEIANAWAAFRQPFREAYARRCQAGAALRSGDRQQAQNAVLQAYSIAGEIGATPLRVSIKEFAHAVRLRLDDVRPYNLTATEVVILKELATGATNAEIGRRLSVATNTVAVHVSHILRKMDVSRRHEAVVRAHQEGILGD